MNAKHTPGPWETDLTWCQPSYNHHVVYVHQGPMVIAQCWLTDVFGQCTTEANARLIAAAPDLLELAKKVERYILSLPAAFLDIEATPRACLLADARAAIAKATGK